MEVDRDDDELPEGLRGARTGLETECSCGHRFEVPRSLAGGVTNCPACRGLVELADGTSTRLGKLLFRSILGLLGLLFAAAALWVFREGNWQLGLLVLGAGALVFVIILGTI